ncbi:GNAT family N-acetyltransferase [Pannus brasiliensis CCIBt3594]|uniref:GNAT family N-acetyltransferase n=1 Tax=Pannus brasiliensis CCIBt3594 TaxID=1427578 RepID=A0AAW9R0Y8_9CHRO
MKWIISPLDREFEKTDFDCNESRLNDYLKKYASQNQKKGYSLTFVATEPESKKVVGYYSVSASSIEFANLPESIKKGLPKYPAPVMLIGQLAVDKTSRGRGLGRVLLMHALNKAIRLSEEIAIFAVRVDAIDERSREFYLKYGFVPLQDSPLSLLLPVRTIIQSRVNPDRD